MLAYIVRRLLLIIPTLFGIMVLNFAIVQFAPGRPVEQTLARIKGTATDATTAVVGNQSDQIRSQSQEHVSTGGDSATYRGARGLDPDLIKEIERMYGFDKPAYERFFIMMKGYVTFD